MSRISDLLEKCESSRYSNSLQFYPNNLDYDDEELLKALKSVGINPDKAYSTNNLPFGGPGAFNPRHVLEEIATSSKELPSPYDGEYDLTFYKLRSAKVVLVDLGPDKYIISDKKDIPELTKAFGSFKPY